MRKTYLPVVLCLLSLAFAAQSFASCSPGFVYFGGYTVYEDLADTDFAAATGTCPTTIWYYEHSNRGTTGICNGFFNGITTYARFMGPWYPETSRVYQVAHLPSSSDPGYNRLGYWYPAFDYSAVGTGSYADTVEMKIYDNDTGALVWSSGAVHGGGANPCQMMTYSFYAPALSGTNVRVEIVSNIASTDFNWKISGIHLQNHI